MWVRMSLYHVRGVMDILGPVQQVELNSDLSGQEMVGEGLAALFYGRDGDQSDQYCVEVEMPDFGMTVRESKWYPFDEEDCSGRMLVAAVNAILESPGVY